MHKEAGAQDKRNESPEEGFGMYFNRLYAALVQASVMLANFTILYEQKNERCPYVAMTGCLGILMYF